MKVIGLCGGSGSGKGTVSKMLSAYGMPIIDTDGIYHNLTSSQSPCLDALRMEFGDIIIKNNSLHRPTLAKMVFASENAEELRAKLNAITHKFVMDEVHRQLTCYKDMDVEYCIVDIPLLFESGFDKECDITVAVIADREKRVERIIARDGITREAAEQRINSQLTDEKLIKLSDIIILNSGDVSQLETEVGYAIEKIRYNLKGIK